MIRVNPIILNCGTKGSAPVYLPTVTNAILSDTSLEGWRKMGAPIVNVLATMTMMTRMNTIVTTAPTGGLYDLPARSRLP